MKVISREYGQITGTPHKHVMVRCENCGFDFMARPDVDLEDYSVSSTRKTKRLEEEQRHLEAKLENTFADLIGRLAKSKGKTEQQQKDLEEAARDLVRQDLRKK